MTLVQQNIVRIIREKGYLKKGVAERAGFSEQQFSDMINGRKVIRAEMIPAITKALQVEPTELFREEDRKEGEA